MGRVCAAVALALVAWAYTGVSGVELVNGRYEDMVIALDPQMEMDVVGGAMQQNLQNLVDEMGSAMTASTEGRLSLASVRVVLPHWWNITSGITLTSPDENFSWRNSDIRLVEPRDDTGTYIPNTLQAGQCGVPGHYITIHTNFLDPVYANANYGPQGYVLMHEWAHYRWGVWEEYGYPNDPVYPVNFQDENLSTSPTSCHHGPLEGKFETSGGVSCTPDGTNKCYFYPDSQSNASTTKASLMSLTHLSEGNFCDETTHHPWAPTPQNLLCGRRSVWELLRTHPDFENTIEGATPSQPKITYHKAPQARLFFLFDAPTSVDQAERAKNLLGQVVTKNIELYGSLQLGLATFRADLAGQMEILKDMSFASVDDVSTIVSYMPDENDRLTGGTMPLGEALMSLVNSWVRYEPGTILVALTWNTASKHEVDLIKSDTLLNKRVKLLALNPDGVLEQLVNLMPLLQDSGGLFYDSTPKLTGRLGYGSGQIVVPPNEKTNFEVITLQNHLVSQVNGFMSMTPFNPGEIEVFIFHPMVFREISCAEAANMENFEFYCVKSDSGVFVYFPTTTAVDYALEYKLSVRNGGGAQVEVKVMWSVVEEDATNPQVMVDVWSSEEARVRANIPEANNIILFCQISHPRGIVEDVMVEAEVELSDGKDVRTQTLTLLDDGKGVVDVRARDGVWSATVGGSWSDGTDLTVTRLSIQQKPKTSYLNSDALHRSSDTEGRARVGGPGSQSSVLPRDPSKGLCCGSFAEGSSLRIVVINQILRRPYTTKITRNVEELPPRVVEANTDQSHPLTVVGDTVEVLITWGGVAQKDAASMEKYMIRYHSSLARLRENFKDALQPLDGSGEAPASAASQTVVLPFSPGDPDLYIAVAYVSSEAVVGPPSPPVIVKISDIPDQTTTTTSITTTNPTTNNPTTTNPTTTDPTVTAPSDIDSTSTARTTTSDPQKTTLHVTTTKDPDGAAAVAAVSFLCMALVPLVMLR
ncbi:LOW QUALITY PROTEIN: calcium-activated chloride channel regulator 1-like [Panulirus ornatus]|uniref:LOW QUALITY PROTEIN: calcium-activated chloride channel regulator 1-like n=1 Tax=Panulirus ornatus TaxID=150431 RepID=UPI003A88BECB